MVGTAWPLLFKHGLDSPWQRMSNMKQMMDNGSYSQHYQQWIANEENKNKWNKLLSNFSGLCSGSECQGRRWLGTTGMLLLAVILTLSLALFTKPTSFFTISRVEATDLPPASSLSGDLDWLCCSPSFRLPKDPNPPTYTLHGRKQSDEYGWVSDPPHDNYITALKRYIQAENEYTDAFFQLSDNLAAATELKADLEHLERSLSLVNTLKSDKCGSIEYLISMGQSLGQLWDYGSYVYWTEVESGVIYRRKIGVSQTSPSCFIDTSSPSAIEIIFDAESTFGQDPVSSSPYYSSGLFEVSPFDEDLFAFSYDISGSERFTLSFFQSTKNGSVPLLQASINDSYYSGRWNADGWFFYNAVDPVLGTPRIIYATCVCSQLCGPDSTPILVYQESDSRLITDLVSSLDASRLFIKCYGQVSSYYRILQINASSRYFTWEPADGSPPILFKPQHGVSYSVEYLYGYYYILTNAAGAFNYQVIRVSADAIESVLASGREPCSVKELIQTHHCGSVKLNLVTLFEHSPDSFVELMEVSKSKILLWVHERGVRRLLTAPIAGSSFQWSVTNFPGLDQSPHSVYSLMPGVYRSDLFGRNFRSLKSPVWLVSISSPLTPSEVMLLPVNDFHESPTSFFKLKFSDNTKNRPGKHWKEVREYVSSSTTENIKIPLTVIYDPHVHGSSAPLSSDKNFVMLVYGAYGDITELSFVASHFALLQRGIGVAICHPRGSADFGQNFYEDGKGARKMNTFHDTFDCLTALVELGYSAYGRISLFGRSAGGLVAGWAMNHPVFHPFLSSIVTQVPFVDVINDMRDPDLAWVAFEYEEWGNPVENVTIFDTMLSYSPYETVWNGFTHPRLSSPTVSLPKRPALLVTGGMGDSRVPYWEPCKFIARLRDAAEMVGDESRMLLRITNFGHAPRDDDLLEWFIFMIAHFESAK